MKLIFCVVSVLPFLSKNVAQDDEVCKNLRLPKNLLPNHYEITVNLPNSTTEEVFTGSVKIHINCVHDDTDTISLHSARLIITTQSITVKAENRSDDAIHVISSEIDISNEMIRLKLDSNLTKGNYVLNIPEFSGQIHTFDKRGLFRTSDSNSGTDSEVYCTFFEPTYARMVFPCFDEPNMKATFIMKVERPHHLKSHSNMPINSSRPASPDRHLDIFQKSPKMSTYLLALIVSNFSTYQKNASDRTGFLVPQNDFDTLDLEIMNQVANDALREMERYTSIPYQLDKLQHVAMIDYEFLGMEHWGLIVYQSSLFRQGLHSALDRQRMVTVIMHEIAHQWFGNLVTLDWWGNLWLNEGFANYFQYVIGDAIFPEWRYHDQFIVNEFQPALVYDEERERKPLPMSNKYLLCNVRHMFATLSGVSYQKGATILRLFQGIIGNEEHFRSALRIYLNRGMMRTTKPADLFNALDEINNRFEHSHLPKNVTFQDIGSTWITQAGVPLVTVTRIYSSGAVNISQERFYYNPGKHEKSSVWWIPLTWTTASAPESRTRHGPREWLFENKTFQLGIAAAASDWVLFNTDVTGYYRVNYDTENWRLLAEGLKSNREKFSAANRAQILDDAVTLGVTGRLNLEIVLNITQFLMDEDDRIVWISAEKNLSNLLMYIESTNYFYWQNKNYIRQLITKGYDLISKSGKNSRVEESHLDRTMRESLQNFACKLAVKSCKRDRLLTWLPQWITQVFKE